MIIVKLKHHDMKLNPIPQSILNKISNLLVISGFIFTRKRLRLRLKENKHENRLSLRLINRLPNLTVDRLKFDYYKGLNFGSG